MSDKIFQSLFPSPDDLIQYAIKQIPLKSTEDKRWTILKFLVTTYHTFIANDDIPAHNGEFWISDPGMRRFPEAHFKESLQKFFASSVVLGSVCAKNLKHEHLRILFFIAALRYTRRLQEPQQQIKFQKRSHSKGDIFDLFLFHRHQTYPAFALQIRLLTDDDLDSEGNILLSSRGLKEREKRIKTFDQYTKASIETLNSKISAFNKQSTGERKTQGCVILVRPFGIDWHGCGFYYESLTSGLVNQPRTEKNLSISVISSQHSDQNERVNLSNFHVYSSQNMNSIQFPGPPLPKPQHVWSENNSVISWTSKNVNFSEIPSRAPSICPVKERSVHTISSSNQERSQASYHTNWIKYNRPHFNQIASQYAMLPNLLQGLASAQAQSGQPNLNQPVIIVIADPNVMASFQNPSGDQISSGVRRRTINGFKAKSTI